jgi:glycosyltransferase involved in cell wall biosynthesis/GT2 family glycosyltransferase
MVKKVQPLIYAVVTCVPAELGALAALSRHLRQQNLQPRFAPIAMWPAPKLRALKALFQPSELLLSAKDKAWTDTAGLVTYLRETPPSAWFCLLQAAEWPYLPFSDAHKCCAALKAMRLNCLRAANVASFGIEARQRVLMLNSAHLPEEDLVSLRENEQMLLSRGPIQAAIGDAPTTNAEALVRMPTTEEQVQYRQTTRGLHPFQAVAKGDAIPGRIALVSFEFMGATASGGIGTAMSALAEVLVRHGHHVEVLFCPYLAQARMPKKFLDEWKARGVHITWMPRRIEGGQYPPHDAFAYRLMKKLEGMGEFDVIHFHDSAGYGAMPLLMRAAGLAFQNTKIAVTLHGPSQWHKRGNYLAWNLDEAYHNHFEEIQHRLADIVISPSQYMLDWVRDRHTISSNTVVVPNALPIESRAFLRKKSELVFAKRLIFFGRAEHRKGIDLFMAALVLLAERGFADLSITVLGALGDGVTEAQLRAMAGDLPMNVQVESGLGHRAALAMLRSEACIVVLPSRLDNSPYTVYECLENAIPFIATDVGGISELIHPQDRARVLVEAKNAQALADALGHSLVHGAMPARLALQPAMIDMQLVALHGELVRQARQSREIGASTKKRSGVTALIHSALSVPYVELVDELQAQGVKSIQVTNPRQLDRIVQSIKTPLLLFAPAGLRLAPNAVDAMVKLLESTGADAVCASSRVLDLDKNLFALAGPRELAAIRSGYGSGVFLIRRNAFVLPPGAVEMTGSMVQLHRHVLNALAARGSLVLGLPEPLVLGGMDQLRKGLAEPDPALASRLAAPWVDALPQHVAGLARMAATHEAAAGFNELQAWLYQDEKAFVDNLAIQPDEAADIVETEEDISGAWRLGLEMAFRTDATMVTTVADTSPSLSILICTHNRPAGLARLLESLRPQLLGLETRELIVWNDGTHSDAYQAVVNANADLISYYAGDENVGVARARNLAARQASNDYLVFVDDDCVAPRWWLDWLQARLVSMPGVDVVAGITSALKEPGMGWAARVQSLFSMLPRPLETDEGILFVTANVALRREAFWQAGGFTDCKTFSGAGEDTELSLRLHSLGYRLVIDNSWLVYHEVGEAFRSRVRRYWRYGLANEWMHARPATRRHVEAVLRETSRLSPLKRFVTEFDAALPVARLECNSQPLAWLMAANKAASTVSYFMGCRAAQRQISKNANMGSSL